MQEDDLNKVKTAYNIIKAIGKQQQMDMFSKKGEAVIKAIIAKTEKERSLLNMVDKQMDNKFNSWKEEIREMLMEKELQDDGLKGVPNNVKIAIVDAFKEYKQKELKKIEEHVNEVKDDNGKKLTWNTKLDTDEITKLVCSNGHSITITKSPDGVLLGRIDNEPNIKIKESDIKSLQLKVQKMEQKVPK